VHGGHEVLVKIDEIILLIVGDLQGILDKLLRPQLVNLLNIIILLIYFIK
jgi:hypothetical protein